MDKRLNKILAACIAEMERGDSVETCLSRYPGLAHQLRAHLEVWQAMAAASLVEPVSSPHGSRQAMLAALAANSEGGRPMPFALPKTLAMAAGVGVFIAVISGGSSMLGGPDPGGEVLAQVGVNDDDGQVDDSDVNDATDDPDDVNDGPNATPGPDASPDAEDADDADDVNDAPDDADDADDVNDAPDDADDLDDVNDTDEPDDADEATDDADDVNDPPDATDDPDDVNDTDANEPNDTPDETDDPDDATPTPGT